MSQAQHTLPSQQPVVSLSALKAARRAVPGDLKKLLGMFTAYQQVTDDCLPINHPTRAHLLSCEAALRDAIEAAQ